MKAISNLMRPAPEQVSQRDRKSTRLNSSHQIISYAVFCLKKKNPPNHAGRSQQPCHSADERGRASVRQSILATGGATSRYPRVLYTSPCTHTPHLTHPTSA